jgi:hypothetical protein
MRHCFATVTAGLLVTNGSAVANDQLLSLVTDNAALKELHGNPSSTVYRSGFAAAGDGGAAFYNYSTMTCSLNSGLGDNGAQVAPDTGIGCWNADFSVIPANVKQWGAYGDGIHDDSAPINTAIADANILGLGGLQIPAASQFYGICAAHINYAPTGHFQLSAPKGTQIKVLPSCDSAPNEVFYVNIRTPNNTFLYRASNVISGLTLDGYCSTKYVLNHNAGQSFVYHDMMIRNAASGNIITNSADVYFGSGNERHMGYGNWVVNENDPGHQCYARLASLPTYGLYDAGANDDFSGIIVVNSQTGIYSSGDNTFGPGTHVWGGLDFDTSGTTFFNANLRVNIGIQLKDNGTVVGAEFDDPIQTGIYLEGGGDGSGGAIAVIAPICRYSNPPAKTQYCVQSANTTVDAIVLGVMSPQYTGTPSGAFLSNTFVTSNQYDGFQVRSNRNPVASLTAQNAGDNGTIVLNDAGVEGFRWQADGTARAQNLPISCSGKVTGTLWNNNGTMGICP